MGTAHPAGKGVGEVVLVTNDALQHDKEKAILVNEFLGALGAGRGWGFEYH